MPSSHIFREILVINGSYVGSKLAAVYLSVVSTVKLDDQSVWRSLGDFFDDMVTGWKNHLSFLSLLTV